MLNVLTSTKDAKKGLYCMTTPHIAKTNRQTREKLIWEFLPHQAYSPDLAPSDYHLFRSMLHFLRDKSERKEVIVRRIGEGH